MITYKTKVHGKCPFNRDWDYYDLTIRSESMMKCEDLEAICNIVRGATMTQENIAYKIRELIPAHCLMTLVGNHANVETVVDL